MYSLDKLLAYLPNHAQNHLDLLTESITTAMQIRNPKVLMKLGPSGVRGFLLKSGKTRQATKVLTQQQISLDWTFPQDHPEMVHLYRKAKKEQWNAETDIAWHTDVDPLNPHKTLLPEWFLNFDYLAEKGVVLDKKQRVTLLNQVATWMLSQFLHGEQGALLAALQVTEAIDIFDGKIFGSTQVMDEGRHIEVFHRYLDTKLGKVYQINDNLFVIIDALMRDSRWDIKFLGMQIMVEGLALGAFTTLYRITQEPLLRQILERVIRDEARHVHYGVLAIKDHVKQLSEKQRREREDWAYEVAILMRERFLAYEVFEEHFEGLILRKHWRQFVLGSQGMDDFRRNMFRRLIPNLREVGLLSPRMQVHYQKAGLMGFYRGSAANQLTADEILDELDETKRSPSVFSRVY